MTTFELVDYYLFNLISPIGPVIKSSSATNTMVKEMNDVYGAYLSKKPIHTVLKKCVCSREGHQYCISNDAVKQAVDALKKSVHVSALEQNPLVENNRLVNSFTDFEELYDFVNSVIGYISGIGALTVYDTSKRIGHLFENAIYPKMYVYLNAGAMEGAKALLGRDDLKFREPANLFEPFFGTFPSVFTEDILCIFKNKFCTNSILTTTTSPTLTKTNDCFCFC